MTRRKKSSKAEKLKNPEPAGDPCEQDSPGAGEVRKTALALTGVVFVLFVASVFAYERYGGPWVDRLDDEIGEVVVKRAFSLADAGLTEEAIAAYRETLTIAFSDPRQRVWNGRRFLGWLIEEQRYAEAVELAKATLAHAPDMTMYTQLIDSLRELGRHEEIVQAAQEWHRFAEEEGKNWAVAWAKFREGRAHSDLGRTEEALNAFLAGHSVYPMVENPWAAAQILCAQGRHDEARPLLLYVIERSSGTEAGAAQALLDRIDGEGSAK